jgi:hypothetical protein
MPWKGDVDHPPVTVAAVRSMGTHGAWLHLQLCTCVRRSLGLEPVEVDPHSAHRITLECLELVEQIDNQLISLGEDQRFVVSGSASTHLDQLRGKVAQIACRLSSLFEIKRQSTNAPGEVEGALRTLDVETARLLEENHPGRAEAVNHATRILARALRFEKDSAAAKVRGTLLWDDWRAQ